jgi:hypothetical protein
MVTFSKVIALGGGKKAILIRAFLMLWIARIGVYLVPLQGLQKVMDRSRILPFPGIVSNASPDMTAWAVAVASRYGPGSTCLVRALATQELLAQQGLSSDLHIGVSKGDTSPFDAHAWVEMNGRVVIGGPRMENYTKLWSLKK